MSDQWWTTSLAARGPSTHERKICRNHQLPSSSNTTKMIKISRTKVTRIMFPDRSSGFTSVLRDSPRGEEDGISISDLDPIGTSSRVFKIRKRRVNFKEHARRTEERRWYRGARKCYGVQGTREEGVNDHGGWTQEPRRKATIRCTALLAAATILFLRLNACWRNSTFSVRTNFTNPDLSPRGGSLEPRIMPQPCTLPIVLSLRNFRVDGRSV